MSHASDCSSATISLCAARLAVAALALGASGAMAAETCSGSLQSSLLHKLPVPVTVTLQPDVDDAVNPHLARRFADGLQAAGVALSRQGNMMMSMAVSLSMPPSAVGGGINGNYKGFDWVSGEQTATQPIVSANLTLSATLADLAQATQSWVVSLQCVVRTNDSAALAYDLGQIIGRNIGIDQSNRNF